MIFLYMLTASSLNICMCLCVIHTHFYCSFCSYLEKLYLFVFVNIYFVGTNEAANAECFQYYQQMRNVPHWFLFEWSLLSSFHPFLVILRVFHCVFLCSYYIYEYILYLLQPHRFACMLPLHIYNKKLHLRSSTLSLSLSIVIFFLLARYVHLNEADVFIFEYTTHLPYSENCHR